MSSAETLANVKANIPYKITKFSCPDKETETRLREIGFAEGDEVELLHTGLFGRTPMAVRLNDALIAIRRIEAGYIELEDA